MDLQEPMTPPKELWLVFDFTNLSLAEMKKVYHMIKNDTGSEEDIIQLELCYREKKQIHDQQLRNNDIPKMKKPFKKKISPPTQKEVVKEEPKAPVARCKNIVPPLEERIKVEEVSAPKIMKKMRTVPAPRQWWAYRN
tara:strand:- start:2364 stop:2777 length:414 start_codon:yes stop_codon:yes gene_type:complete